MDNKPMPIVAIILIGKNSKCFQYILQAGESINRSSQKSVNDSRTPKPFAQLVCQQLALKLKKNFFATQAPIGH
jgi:hypothetical protein